MGEWDCKRGAIWTYRVDDQARPYGYALARPRQRGTWDALVLGAEVDGDMTLAEGVTLDEAKAVVERHVARHAGRA